MSDEYDVIVLGAGPAGENAAARVAGGGLTAAIVERDLVGGECSYWACMPSKALLRPGEAARAAQRVPGVNCDTSSGVSSGPVLEKRNSLASNWDDKPQVDWLGSVGVDLVRGIGRLDGERIVRVTLGDGEEREITAHKAVVLATGSKADIPPIAGIESVGAWDNRDITSATEVPDRLGIIGGGVVGVEMAQAWNDLGAGDVVIFEMAERLLSNEEPFAHEHLRNTFEAQGIGVRCGVTVEQASLNGAGEVVIDLDDGTVHTFDRLLVATGRKPRTEDLGLETVGLEPGDFVTVDDRLAAQGVDGDWLYAVGDVNGRSLLTHNGKYQARIAADVILGRSPTAWGDSSASPRVIFTDPNVAAVGLTEAQAREKGANIRTIEYSFGGVAGASIVGEGIEGTVKIVVDEDKRTIVGATFVGPGAGEMIHAATIAVAGEVTLDQLWHAIPAFPTISEVWLRLLESYGL